MSVPQTSLQLRSLITEDGWLQLSLAETELPPPQVDEVVVRVEATPINPSDMFLMFGPADLEAARDCGTRDMPAVTAPIPAKALVAMKARLGQSLPVGNEGAGTVVAAGGSPLAQSLLGHTVAVRGGAMYSQYRVVPAAGCLKLREGTSAAAAASSFVNPLTALGMVETMRLEGHAALVHTAAASNLGQMLDRLCRAEGVGLVNIVRRSDQAVVLRRQGAVHVCDSSSESFIDDLTAALVQTNATLAFDAVGGGELASRILSAMEAAIASRSSEFSRYGSSIHKQVYIYGGLDAGPTEIRRNFGMSWGIGGWLMTPFLQRIGPEATERLKARVAAELDTTFASRYSRTISLREALSVEAITAYGSRSTDAKVLINPNMWS